LPKLIRLVVVESTDVDELDDAIGHGHAGIAGTAHQRVIDEVEGTAARRATFDSGSPEQIGLDDQVGERLEHWLTVIREVDPQVVA
jgi:hypothetical protein